MRTSYPVYDLCGVAVGIVAAARRRALVGEAQNLSCSGAPQMLLGDDEFHRTILVGNSLDRRQSATRTPTFWHVPGLVRWYTSVREADLILTPTVERSEFPILRSFYNPVMCERASSRRATQESRRTRAPNVRYDLLRRLSASHFLSPFTNVRAFS
jgi:hypothetical protein